MGFGGVQKCNNLLLALCASESFTILIQRQYTSDISLPNVLKGLLF